ncbi:uncharacterized protein LOC131938024 isoform X2 [Physella acuta]|uniref:uncharacterized protein LOC131938024 isoform X2 n=1 Tax=Physella acuta TaxID=109671 RepID=UPI0027DBE352|nr:uncharacterized protein LOC131938024 isoform X2 [Physella acuta]
MVKVMEDKGSGWNLLVLTLCLLTSVLMGQTTPSSPQSMISFNMYLANMSWQDNQAISNTSSAAYNLTKAKIEEFFQPIGGILEDVIFSNSPEGCTKAYIQLRYSDQDKEKVLSTLMGSVVTRGLTISNTTWLVSFKGCQSEPTPTAHILVFKLYINSLPWTDDYLNHTSSSYLTLVSSIQANLLNWTGQLGTMRIAKNYGCIEVYIEWSTTENFQIFTLIEELKKSGIKTANGILFISTKPCLPSLDESDQCPVVKQNIDVPCVDTCNDSNKICPSGFKCCHNFSCHFCLRIGYRIKITGSLLVNISMQETSMVDQLQLQDKMTTMMKGKFFGNLTAVDYMRNSFQNSEGSYLFKLVLYFNDDLSNEVLESARFQVENSFINISQAGIRIMKFEYETSDQCDQCAGICKELLSGEVYCSCSQGYIGTDCTSFDCRTNYSQFPNTSVSLCENNGSCTRQDDNFKCMCQSGYYGDYCQVGVCGLINCGNNGTCVGSFNDGRLCQCQSDRGGLFCEETKPDNLTECERKRRLGVFVQNVLAGNTTIAANRMTIPLKELLASIKVGFYEVPTCNVTDGSFYSSCTYEMGSDSPPLCSCRTHNTNLDYCAEWQYFVDEDYFLNMDWSDELIDTRSNLYHSIISQFTSKIQSFGATLISVQLTKQENCVKATIRWSGPNSAAPKAMITNIFIQEKLVTVSTSPCSSPLSLLQFSLYVDGLEWNQDFQVNNSNAYNNIRSTILEVFQELAGSIHTLLISQKENCTVLFIEWTAASPVQFLNVMDRIKTKGITLNGELFQVNTSPCKPDEKLLLEFQMFVKLLPWSEQLKNLTSPQFAQIKDLVEKTFAALGGTCIQLVLAPKAECVMLFIQWETTINNTELFLGLMENIKKSGVTFMGKKFDVSTKECEISVLEDDVQILQANFVVNMSYIEELQSQKSYLELEMSQFLLSYNMPGFKSASIISISSYDSSQFRGKRQIKTSTLFVLELLFNSSLSVESINMAAIQIKAKPLLLGGLHIQILNISFGDAAGCPACSAGSLCLSDKYGLKFCACSDNRSGPTCSVQNCVKNKPCLNSGTCSFSYLKQEPQCHCQAGYTGTNCEVNLCQLVKEGACQSGACVMDLIDWNLCSCPYGTSGLFCQNSQNSPAELSICEKKSQVMTYLLSVLQQEVANEKFSVEISQLLAKIDDSAFISVPACKNGWFYSTCNYNKVTGKIDVCYCVNENNTALLDLDYNTSTKQCQVSSNACKKVTCLNNGRCENMENGNFSCKCPPMFEGTLCETPCSPEKSEVCRYPEWWCSNELKCKEGLEKCLRVECSGCPEKMKLQCIAKEKTTPCDPQPCHENSAELCDPCSNHGTCYLRNSSVFTVNQLDHVCVCNKGRAGVKCQVNNELCSQLPANVCKFGCVGDLDKGILCQCPYRLGGINCSTPVNTPCERKKAFFEDVADILSTENVPVEKAMVQLIKRLYSNSSSIPQVSCDAVGQFHQVQCNLSVQTWNVTDCYCVNTYGTQISSNTKSYIGYNLCTGPQDFRSLAALCKQTDSGESLVQCFNGGTCVLDPYEGKLCDCPKGYFGQFCEKQGSPTNTSRSFCGYLADSWESSRYFFSTNSSNLNWTVFQRELYKTLTYNFLTPNDSLALKAECTESGHFEATICYFDLTSDMRGTCYCWGPNGPIFDTPVTDQSVCQGLIKSACPRKCPSELICQFGYTVKDGCPTCECTNPCLFTACQHGTRCITETKVCPNSPGYTCVLPVCRLVEKPGVCPFMSFVQEPSGANPSCEDQCLDDSDCHGNTKCCGACPATCVEPKKSWTCQDARLLALKYVEESLEARKQLLNNSHMDTSAQSRRVLRMETFWIPDCDGDFFKPLQCMTPIKGDTGFTDPCLCVDQLGNIISGSQANKSEANSCRVKPNFCPLPVGRERTNEECLADLDCLGEDKCCYTGVTGVCTRPVDKLLTFPDKLLTNLCQGQPSVCENNSTCVNQWVRDGVICQCSQSWHGPFCQQNGSLPTQTVCQRKAMAHKVLLSQLQEETSQGITALLDMHYSNYKSEVLPMVELKCLDNGDFAPTQCVTFISIFNLTALPPRQCFCVNQHGEELPGTRLSDQRPFCGENNQICPFGHPLTNSSGVAQECHEISCPIGYSCQHSTYGSLFCCPDLESNPNQCVLPVDFGVPCSGNANVKDRYYFDGQECKHFQFNGCGGNLNNFPSVSACQARCLSNKHTGSCPATPVKVRAKVLCQDQCQLDDNCHITDKCCQTTCGKRCVPTIVDSEVGKCPMGRPYGRCDTTTFCPSGLVCQRTGQELEGICCIDYSNVDLCLIPPNLSDSCPNMTQRYFFNATSNKCQQFLSTGCLPDFNNFNTLEQCCLACNDKGRCKSGTCPDPQLGSVSKCSQECSGDAQCPGKRICCSTGCGTACLIPEAGSDISDCIVRQTDAKMRKKTFQGTLHNDCDVINIPRCEENGSWSKLQCQTTLGICWCVTDLGNYVNGTISRGVPACHLIPQAFLDKADLDKMDVSTSGYTVCPGGTAPKCCPESLCLLPCFAHPDAVCRIDPCTGCSIQYFDQQGIQVNCNEGLSKCQQEANAARVFILEQQLNSGLDPNQWTGAIKTWKPRTTLLKNVPLRCQLAPDAGTCRGFSLNWFYNPLTGSCDSFVYTMCGGNTNRFSSPEECYSTCNMSASPCHMMKCDGEQPLCRLTYDPTCLNCSVTATCQGQVKQPSLKVSGIFVAQCQITGEYMPKQCHDGYCWCVNSQGQAVTGLTRAASLTCSPNGTDIKTENCTNNKPPNLSCLQVCTGQKCPAYPNATCVADLCSPTCDRQFVDTTGSQVMCTDNLCSTFTFNASKQKSCSGPSLCEEAKLCPESICQKVSKDCSLNPCAICLTDPCTCLPYFVDVNTRRNLTHNQCHYLSTGVCAITTCNLLKESARIEAFKLDELSPSPPQCDARGRFLPQQCLGEKCQCVTAFGISVSNQTSINETCQDVGDVKLIKLNLKFNGDFKKFQRENLLDQIKKQVYEKIVELGIDPTNILELGEPYEGSIKMVVTFQLSQASHNPDLIAVYLALMYSLQTNWTIVAGNETLELDIDWTSLTVLSTDDGVPDKHASTEGLSARDKIIVGCVVGIGGGLILLAGILLIVCCRNKKHKAGGYHAGLDNQSLKPAILNYAYDDDDDADGRFIKVKL